MKYLVVFLLSFSFFSLAAQETNLIKWKKIQQADSIQINGDNRLLLVDVYTDWCGPCKLMDQQTFQNEEVASYINENFIPVKFNAEAKEDVIFKGKVYQWVSNGRSGLQSLAYFALGGDVRYPSIALINQNGETLTVISGFYPAQDFLEIVKDLKSQIDQELAKTGS